MAETRSSVMMLRLEGGLGKSNHVADTESSSDTLTTSRVKLAVEGGTGLNRKMLFARTHFLLWHVHLLYPTRQKVTTKSCRRRRFVIRGQSGRARAGYRVCR